MNNADKPAYPYVDPVTMEQGLTKLELFTKAAMQGLCSRTNSNLIHDPTLLAAKAKSIADATLKQLEKSTPCNNT